MVAELGLSGVCEADLSALRYICECVSRRAGFMCAAGLTALIKKMDYKVRFSGKHYTGGHGRYRKIMRDSVVYIIQGVMGDTGR